MRMKGKIFTALALILILSACSIQKEGAEDKGNITAIETEESDKYQEKEIIMDSVEHYSVNYFRFLENIRIDKTDDGMSLFIEFIPEVGSFPVKEEIYQSVVFHALQVNSFFEEINEFRYVVLWDDRTKQKAMELVISGDEVSNLSNVYYGWFGDQNAGLETTLKNAFSDIVETEESRSWRD